MRFKTHNDLVYAIAETIKELGNRTMDQLRSDYPEATETEAELIRFCKESKFSRGELIEAIIIERFITEDINPCFEE